MKKFHFLSAAAIIAGCLLFAADCEARREGSGKMSNETRTFVGFHGVELAAAATLDIVQGDRDELSIDAEDNVLPFIESAVLSDGTLRLRVREQEVRPTRPVAFKLTVKTLDKIVLSGSGKIRVGQKFSAERETLELPGSGSIVLENLETSALTVALEGSGTVKVVGSAGSQEVKIAGSGSYEAEALRTDAAAVSVSGSGACKVWAEKTLNASISGSGAVTYRGNPEVKQHVSGSGSVRAVGSKAI